MVYLFKNQYIQKSESLNTEDKNLSKIEISESNVYEFLFNSYIITLKNRNKLFLSLELQNLILMGEFENCGSFSFTIQAVKEKKSK